MAYPFPNPVTASAPTIHSSQPRESFWTTVMNTPRHPGPVVAQQQYSQHHPLLLPPSMHRLPPPPSPATSPRQAQAVQLPYRFQAQLPEHPTLNARHYPYYSVSPSLSSSSPLSSQALSYHPPQYHPQPQYHPTPIPIPSPISTIATVGAELPVAKAPTQLQETAPAARKGVSKKRSKKVNRFPCPHCTTSFKQRSHLNAHHRVVHLKIKPYACGVCGYAFGKRYDLKQHMSAVHRDIRPHQCTKCDRSFAKKSNLQRHAAKVHRIIIG